MRHLESKEQDIIIDSLLLQIKDLQDKLQKSDAETDSYRFQTLVFKYFLADNHPEMTSEFAEFVLEQSKDNIIYGDETKYAYKVLDYHRDSIENDRLDEILEILKKNR